MTTVEDRAIQALLDKQAIREVLMRYCRGIDRMDVDLIKSAYHPDGWDEHGQYAAGGWEYAEKVVERLRPLKATMHYVTNHLIELDGDVAHGEAYLLSHARFARGEEEFERTVGARYIDRYERRNDEWRIAHRTIVQEWSRIDRVGEKWDGAAAFRHGVRSREDLVYRSAPR